MVVLGWLRAAGPAIEACTPELMIRCHNPPTLHPIITKTHRSGGNMAVEALVANQAAVSVIPVGVLATEAR